MNHLECWGSKNSVPFLLQNRVEIIASASLRKRKFTKRVRKRVKNYVALKTLKNFLIQFFSMTCIMFWTQAVTEVAINICK